MLAMTRELNRSLIYVRCNKFYKYSLALFLYMHTHIIYSILFNVYLNFAHFLFYPSLSHFLFMSVPATLLVFHCLSLSSLVSSASFCRSVILLSSLCLSEPLSYSFCFSPPVVVSHCLSLFFPISPCLS